jgi:hypothetical protein
VFTKKDFINTMLYVSTNITKFQEFSEEFRKTHGTVIDLSKVASAELCTECDSIVSHHKNCAIFLGYIEPGWMLDSPSQTRLRKLFRKFPVAFVCNFLESLPFSWKNEIDILYLHDSKNGGTALINDGCAVHNKFEV